MISDSLIRTQIQNSSSFFRILQSIHPATSTTGETLPNSPTAAVCGRDDAPEPRARVPGDGDAAVGKRGGERRHRRLPRQDGQRGRSAAVLINVWNVKTMTDDRMFTLRVFMRKYKSVRSQKTHFKESFANIWSKLIYSLTFADH